MGQDVKDALDLALKEYELLTGGIARFDELRSKVKEWMITTSGGLFALILTARITEVGWAGAFVVLAFGGTELGYALTQAKVIDRACELEAMIHQWRTNPAGFSAGDYRFGPSHAYMADPRVRDLLPQAWEIVRWRTMALPLYAILFVSFIAIAVIGPQITG